MGLVKSTVERGVALVTLDDARRRNIISIELSAELSDLMDRFEADPEVKAVVITGAPPAFSGGGDLADLEAARGGDTDRLHGIYKGFLKVAASSLPTTAAVNGPAVGAGLNLALACDIRIAGQAARFDCRFMDLALHPGGGHSWMLTRAVGRQAATAMLLFGQVLDGAGAEKHGLAWKCVADADLVSETMALAQKVSDVPRELVKVTKNTLAVSAGTEDRLAAAGHEFIAQLWSAREDAFGARVAAMKARISGAKK
jgi:enoyl-CoA hydratase